MSLSELHRLEDLGADGFRGIASRARRLRERPEPEALRGRVLGLLFLNPSLRTQASCQAAMARLGGSSFVLAPDRFIHRLELAPDAIMDGEAAENIAEAIPVLASYADALGVRAFASQRALAEDLVDPVFERIRALADKPFLNLESSMRHPCQAVADWLSLDDFGVRPGAKFTLAWANHPAPLPLAVPADTLRMAAMRGMRVTVLRPEGYALPPAVMGEARDLAATSGGSVRETEDIREGMDGARVLYAKSWASTAHYGDREADLEARRSLGGGWTVDEPWFHGADPACDFMHCLPVRRGVVVTRGVLEGPRSRVVRQAENRMWAQMAVLHRMLASSPAVKTR